MARVLGISAFYHDSAACLVEDGRVVAALQEERFSRLKHDSAFPERAVSAALRIGGRSMGELDCVVFYEKPFMKLERLLDTYVRNCPRGLASYLKAMPVWFREKLWIKEQIRRQLEFDGPILFADHHESHAASAFFASPFESAALLTLDGVGEWTTTSLGRGRGTRIELLSEVRFPHSLGLLYTAFTYYLGFRVNSGEYKVMGLAPYGTPRYEDLIREHLIQVNDDGSFRLDTRYFNYETGLRMTSRRFDELFGGPPRRPGSQLDQRHKDLAASIQKVTEDVVLKICGHLRRESGEKHLCMAGGVALNCVANGRILREAGFEDLWVQPAAGDAGGALGAALAVSYGQMGLESRVPGEAPGGHWNTLLGTAYADAEIRSVLDSHGARYERLTEDDLLARTAAVLEQGGVVGWFQGRMEFGPRALGSRSILADARRPDMQDHINARIKYRESFRPFAPAVLEESVSDYFKLDRPSPYMLIVADVQDDKRGVIPAVTHVDGSARVQTVGRADNPRFHGLLRAFAQRTGCPVLLNTSFNVRGEPIIESPEQAYQCFMRTGLDLLVIGDFLLEKERQPSGLEPVTGQGGRR
ncbi:MAG: carbamoyltransferase [Acidobacteriota bacterium]